MHSTQKLVGICITYVHFSDGYVQEYHSLKLRFINIVLFCPQKW